MADLDLATKLADHNQYCVAKRRFYGPLAGLCWMVSYGVFALVSALMIGTGFLFHAAVWLGLVALAVDGWWQLQAYTGRDAHRLALAAGIEPTPEVLADRRRWARRGLLPAQAPDRLRPILRILCAAPRLSASAWRAGDDTLPWTHGDLTRANALMHALGARGDAWAPVSVAGADGDLLTGLAALGQVDLRLGETSSEVRIPPALWGRHFAKPAPQREVFVLPSER